MNLPPKKIRVRYYAILREVRGLGEEVVTTQASNIATLYEELKQRYDFKLPLSRVKAAVNDELVDVNTALYGGDCVVFIPPVAGG